MVAHSKWMVSEIVDPRETTLPRYVIAHRQGEAPWRSVWEHRGKLPGKLAAWFKTLADDGIEPLARPLLGHGCALNERTAHAVCKFRIAEIGRMSGCAPGATPDFLMVENFRGGQGHGRPCAVVDGEHVQVFPSIADAARHLGVRKPTLGRAVRRARQYAGGAVAV